MTSNIHQEPPGPQRGSVSHLLLSTAPLFLVLCYFLRLAQIRPTLQRYNLPDDADDALIQSAWSDAQIPLMEMFYVFLSILVIWTSLLIYLIVFVPKRRRLMRTYLNPNVRSVFGEAIYEEPTTKLSKLFRTLFKTDYAMVNYTLSVADEKHRRYFRHGLLSYCSEHIGAGQEAYVKCILIERKVRTYHPYVRERVPILLLPDLPRSGIPKADVETDIATHVGRDRINALLWVVAFWTAFSVWGAFYLLIQMQKVDDEYENTELAWIIFAVTVVVGLPLLAGGGNFFRFLNYKRWLMDSGRITILYEEDLRTSIRRRRDRGSTRDERHEEGYYHKM